MKSILDFDKAKSKNEKITMVTCYDYTFAKILNQTTVDTLLVGDSVAQVIHGHDTTLQATTDMMALHTSAVKKGAPNKFLVTDMPFLSTRKGLKTAMDAVEKIMKAGAHAIKIEGADGHDKLIRHIVESGVPVMGHLGLTPQSIHQLGGPKVQGRNEKQAQKILSDALSLQESGCFSVVLELIPSALAKEITEQLEIPTIGIGAGSATSGQVLVLQDLLGMNADFNPKFLKKYEHFEEPIKVAINNYVDEVRKKQFPTKENIYD